MRPLGMAIILVLTASGGASGLRAQTPCPATGWDLSAGPVLTRDADGARAFGVGLDGGWCRAGHDLADDFARSRQLALGVVGEIPFSDVRTPRNLQAGVTAGVAISLSSRRPIDLDADPDQSLYRFNYGFLTLGARLQYEASVDRDEQAVLAGGEIRWTDPARVLLPSVVLGLEGVHPTRSRARDEREVELEAHLRWHFRGYWRVPLTPALYLDVDTGYFRTSGLHELLRAEGLHRGGFVAPGAGYALAVPLGPVQWESIFLGYAHGQRPTGLESERAWTLGLELAPARR